MTNEVFKRAIYEALSPEYESMIPSAPDHEFSSEFKTKINKLIRRREKPYYGVINTAGKRAACVAAAIIVTFTATVLNVDAAREGFVDFFVNTFEKYSTIRPAEPGNAPEKIEDVYEITYGLRGYTKDVWLDTEFERETEYINGHIHIYFNQTVKGAFDTRFNTEDATIEPLIILGKEAIYYLDNQNYGHIIWDNGDYILILDGNIDKDELIKMAESVGKIG